ncbi:glycosyltransferase family 4 protein [Brevibacillus sp. SIMBA_040]|uniref:glycosyltransferase family 4 protein n=1 Tax=unclassified Brevibacillus TaxID=2684853 RepID=UPI00397B357F
MANFLLSHPYLLEAMDHYYGSSVNKAEQNKRWKILLATYLRYPHMGGVSNYMTTLKEGLQRLGHHVEIASPNQIDIKRDLKGNVDDEIRRSTEQLCLKRYGRISPMIVEEVSKLGVFEAMLQRMDLRKYDILHTHDRRAALILGKLNQSLQKPLFYTPHQLGVHRMNELRKDSVEYAFFQRLDLAALEYARKVILVCDMFRAPFTEIGADPSRFVTVHTGVSFQPIAPASRKGKVIITCITRLEPHKGVTYLLDALSLIPSDLQNVEVRVVGDGAQKAELIKKARTLKLSNVSFLGARSDIAELLSQSDIFVHPAIEDTFPLSIMEAMFASQAIISTTVGGIPELIRNKVTGVLLEPANARQLAGACRALILDPAVRQKLGVNAKAYANKFLTADSMVKKIESVYRTYL